MINPFMSLQDTPGFALGCARLGSVQTPMNAKQCVDLLHFAYDLGVREFDTASIYGQGDSERYLGQAFGHLRANVQLCSKAGQRLSTKHALLSHFKTPIRAIMKRRKSAQNLVATQRDAGVPRCFDPDYIARSLDQSLKRLRTDYLDIFYLHSPDETVMRDPALRDRLLSLKASGRFRRLGISCDDDLTAQASAEDPDIDIVQFAITPTAACAQILDTLARTGKKAVVRGLMAGSSEGMNDQARLAGRIRASIAHPAVQSIIVGTTKKAHLQQNYQAFLTATSQE